MLKSTIIDAVKVAKLAEQDLAIAATCVKRGPAVYVPGSAPTYAETLSDISVVITGYKANEIDGDRIKASDIQGFVFNESIMPRVNDLVRFGGKSYRVISENPVMAGDSIALNQLQLRL